jgi:pimeloyl-ACP methyl ester carboxylesterase
MISFSKNAGVALCLIRSVIYISTVPIVFLCVGALGSCSAQEVLSGRSEAAEFQKLEPALKFLRERNGRTYAITTPNGIDEATYVEIGGIEQWITIRGEDRNNPVLLFLHGGPGDATNFWGYAAFRIWLKYFTVVQWDQRGSGRTLGRNGAASASTIPPTEWRRTASSLPNGRRRNYTRRTSFSSGIPGAPSSDSCQVAAEFGRSSAVAYTALVERASREGNSQALAELKKVGPPPYKDGKGFGVIHKWANLFEGADVFLASALGFALYPPGYTIADINDWFDGQGVSGERLGPHFDELDRKLLGGELAIPVFVIQGAEDYTTPVSLARSYVDELHAPRKAFTTIEGGGHFAVFTKQDEFLKELRRRVLPLIR